ncbi:MAG: YtxH domain-containing protein [bacterium]
MGKFKKGLVLGGALGALLMWLNATPKGKEMREKLLSHADVLFKELKDSLEQLDGPTREMYDALVERAVAEYAGKKEMAVDMKAKLIKELKKRWCKLEKELK